MQDTTYAIKIFHEITKNEFLGSPSGDFPRRAIPSPTNGFFLERITNHGFMLFTKN